MMDVIDLNHPGVWIGFAIFALLAIDLVALRIGQAFNSPALQLLAVERKRNADMHNRMIGIEARVAIKLRTIRLRRERRLGVASEPLEDEQDLIGLQCDIVKALQDNDTPRE